MAYELALLEELVIANLQPKRRIPDLLSDEQLAVYFKLIEQEQSTVVNSFRNRVFEFRNKKQRQFYIQQHQLSIIRLKNKLIERTDEIEKQLQLRDSNDVKLVNRLVEVLQLILDFLKEEFPFYFDAHAAVPVTYLKRVRERMRKGLKKVVTVLARVATADDSTEMFQQALRPVLHDERNLQVSFGMIDYVKNLFEQIEKLKPSEGSSFFHSSFIDLLVRMNFNSELFVYWLIGQLTTSADLLPGEDEKLEYYLLKHKELSQLIDCNDLFFLPDKRSVKEEVLLWLQAEILFLERKQQMLVKTVLPDAAKTAEEEKGIYLTWTVEELGLYMHLLKENGQLVNKNMRDLAKGMSGHFHTVRKEHISWQNLYNCFSKVEMNTIRSLDSKLMDAINLLRKMRGGLR